MRPGRRYTSFSLSSGDSPFSINDVWNNQDLKSSKLTSPARDPAIMAIEPNWRAKEHIQRCHMPDDFQFDMPPPARVVLNIDAAGAGSSVHAAGVIAITLVDSIRLTSECLATSLSDAATDFHVSTTTERRQQDAMADNKPALVLCNINAALLGDEQTRMTIIEQIRNSPQTP